MNNTPTLYRPTQGKVFAGVCSGVADKLNIDATVIRVAAVILTFFGGVGLAGYLGGLAIMPKQGNTELPIWRIAPFTRNWHPALTAGAVFGVVLVGIALLGGSSGGFVVPIGIVALIVFFSTKKRSRNLTQPAEPTPFERASQAWQQRVTEVQAPDRFREPTNEELYGYTTPPAQPNLPAVRKRHGWWLALALAAIGLLPLVVLAIMGIQIPAIAYLGVITLALGAGLLWTHRTGRPKGMLPAAIAAILLTGVLSSVWVGPTTSFPVPLAAPQAVAVGDTTATWLTDADVADVQHDMGQVVIDMSGLHLDADQSAHISLDAGQLTIILPKDVGYEVNWQVDVGECTESGSDKANGLDLAGQTNGPVAGQPTLTLTVTVDIGQLELRDA
ncbi:MAG: PspC domain-containing protein [Propionibacteriaceae bacterium]|nr:PspC domain-containing protein [Propionibacteriaceae bacterium]